MLSTILETNGAFRRARKQPVWDLLAGDDAPEHLTIFYVNFIAAGLSQIPTGRFHERVADDIRAMKLVGGRMDQLATAYCAQWVKDGFLERNPDRTGEGETYSLTPETRDALDIVTQLVTPTSNTTSSKVSSVITQLEELDLQTNPDQQSRLAALVARREAVNAEIDRVLDGDVDPISEDLAVESALGILNGVRTSGADLARLRRDLTHAVDDLRRQAIASDGSRGDVLEMVLARMDLKTTEQGRSFAALYELLSDYELLSKVRSTIEHLLDRPFAAHLSPAEQEGLRDMMGEMRRGAGEVHRVIDTLLANLRAFVEEQRFAEERRIDQALREALREYGRLAETTSLRARVPYELPLTTPDTSSIGQWTLAEVHKPITAELVDHTDENVSELTVEDLHDLADGADIDYHALRDNVRDTLASGRTVVTIGDIVAAGHHDQGVAGIVGLILLALRGADAGITAIIRDTDEVVPWNETTQLRIPKVLFHESEHAHD